MAVITIQGTVKKTGSGEYGPWFVVGETVTKRDGDTFEVRYMCSGKEAPAEDITVVVTGFARSDVREHEGKHYGQIKVSAASWWPLASEQSASPAPAAKPEDSMSDEDIPF